MAIAFDASTGKASNITPTASQTWSHTCTGSNLILFVNVGIANGNTITGVTYNGVAMTLVDSSIGNSNQTFTDVYLYVLVNPATGTNTVSAQTAGSGLSACYGSSVSYTGAAQSGQPPQHNKNTSAGTTELTTTVDTSAAPSTDNCWVVGGYFTNGNFTTSAGASTTLRDTSAGSPNWCGIVDNNAAKTPAGNVSLKVDTSSSSAMSTIAASIAPYVASGPANVKTWDGVTQSTGVKTYMGVAIASTKKFNGVA